MLNDFNGADRVYIACGYTDLRKGIDGLASLVQQQIQLDPFTNALFLFCGRRRDRIKGLYWERDCFILLYKRLEQGSYQWPRSENEVRTSTPQQYRWLMEGLKVEQHMPHDAVEAQPLHYALSDELLLSMSECTAYSEGDPFVWYVNEGQPEGGFWRLAETVTKATAADAARLTSGQARALLAMRAFYFLGVLRGSEAYRDMVADDDNAVEPAFKELPFEVDSELFVDDLNALKVLRGRLSECRKSGH